MYIYRTAVSEGTGRDRFRKLSGFRHKSMCLVNQHASMKWHTRTLLGNCEPKDVFSASECGIFCNFVLDKTCALKAESCDISKWCEDNFCTGLRKRSRFREDVAVRVWKSERSRDVC
jgi:hypothetical protein